MNRALILSFGLAAFSGCLTVTDARESGANHSCRYEDRCGNVGSGRSYASFADCLTSKRADFLNAWPTNTCDGRINGQSLDTCLKAIDNTQCNNIVDQFATLTKCQSNDICTAGTPSGCSSCANGQTCQNGVCR